MSYPATAENRIAMRKCLILSLCCFVSAFCYANPPPAEEIFHLNVEQVDPNTFALDWQIEPGYFLYKERIGVREQADTNFNLGALRLPKARKHLDRQGKMTLIYRNQVVVPVSILGQSAGEGLLDVHYQGCSDDGFCYPPQTTQLKVAIDKNGALAGIVLEKNPLPKGSHTEQTTDGDELDTLFRSNNWPLIIISFFGFGLLLSFTPCVLPMVPVLSGIIVGHGKTLSTRKAFFLSLSYVLSMSATYALVGAVVALMGSNLQLLMQSPWTIGLFSLIFVLLSLSMFNFYELKLPVSWQARLASVTRSQSGGHYLSAMLMGCLSTLILSPCVTAPLIGALSYIANTGNVVLGSFALFSLGLGMGTPLLLIGASAGKLLPKAGHWMNAIKSIFGVLLLAVAIYLLQRIVPAIVTMGLWASLLVLSGIYMGALSRTESSHDKFRQGFGILFLVYGLLVLIGASEGNRNPLQPLTPINQTEGGVNYAPSVTVLRTLTDVEGALAASKGKPVMLDFYADWCVSCKVMDATTLKDPKIQMALSDFVVLKIDVTSNNADAKALLSHFNVVAPPTFLFYDATGHELRKLRLVGDISTNTFYSHLNETLNTEAG